jgi:hypothetical protein
MTPVVLAAAHLDSDPTNNRMKNLRALCQRINIGLPSIDMDCPVACIFLAMGFT